MQFSIERSLKQLKQAIQQIETISYDQICSAIKSICSRLMYLRKYACFVANQSAMEKTQLKQIIKGILTLLKSTQFEKYGHFIPYLGLTVFSYQKYIFNGPLMVEKIRVIDRTVKNEQSPRYNSYKWCSLSTKDVEFSSNPRLENILNKIQANQYQIENPRCIGCSKIFINKSSIKNNNQCYHNIIGISAQESANKQSLKKHINSLCNTGGGVIILGVQNFDQGFLCTGIKVNKFQNIENRLQIVKEVIETMAPSCYWRIDKVVVRDSWASQLPENKKYKLICLRLLIFPAIVNKLTYLKWKKQDKQVLELFKLNQSKLPIQLIPHSLNQNPTETFYEEMHNKYQTLKYFQNSHQYISCESCVPDARIAKELEDLSEEQSKRFQAESLNQETEEEVKTSELFFAYSKTSIIVVPLKCNNREVRLFSKKLTERKISVDLRMPYDGEFLDEEMRQIWMLSHKIDIVQLKKILKTQQNLGSIKEGVIKILPVYKYLQVESARLTEEKQKILQAKFRKRFKNKYIEETGFTTGKNQQAEAVKYMCFEDYSQSIYAYMVLQQLQIRPYFVKEGGSYKKKPKLESQFQK